MTTAPINREDQIRLMSTVTERFEQSDARWAEFHRENGTFDFAKTKYAAMKEARNVRFG